MCFPFVALGMDDLPETSGKVKLRPIEGRDLKTERKAFGIKSISDPLTGKETTLKLSTVHPLENPKLLDRLSRSDSSSKENKLGHINSNSPTWGSELLAARSLLKMNSLPNI